MTASALYPSAGFPFLPDFREFRKVLKSQLFQYRAQLETKMDSLHDETLSALHDRRISIDEDVERHVQWSQNELRR